MKTFSYVIQDPLGLHARPAGIFVKKASSYQSEVKVTNKVTGKSADAKRIMGVMSLGVKQGNEVLLEITGDDEAAAATELKDFMAENL